MKKMSFTAQAVKNEIHFSCVASMCEVVRQQLRVTFDGVCSFIEEQPPEVRHQYYKALGELIRAISSEILEYVDVRSVELSTMQD